MSELTNEASAVFRLTLMTYCVLGLERTDDSSHLFCSPIGLK